MRIISQQIKRHVTVDKTKATAIKESNILRCLHYILLHVVYLHNCGPKSKQNQDIVYSNTSIISASTSGNYCKLSYKFCDRRDNITTSLACSVLILSSSLQFAVLTALHFQCSIEQICRNGSFVLMQQYLSILESAQFNWHANELMQDQRMQAANR